MCQGTFGERYATAQEIIAAELEEGEHSCHKRNQLPPHPNWADWFDGLTITPLPNGTTAISGPVVDQAALHGVLRKVRDLGVPLLSVTRVRPGQADA
jgi:hypothetical protein